MKLETYLKIGILVGIAAVVITLPFMITFTLIENKELFHEFFYNEDLNLKKMKDTEAYKSMMERYPDAIVSPRMHGPFGGSIEMLAFDNNGDNQLRVDLHYEVENDFVYSYARCDVRNNQSHDKLGTIPPEIMDNPPIPKFMFEQGEAQEGFIGPFIKYTNCLEQGIMETENEMLEADHHIAIPSGTGEPGCQETLSCFEPYSLKIKVDQVVSFRNFDAAAHTVTSGIPEFGPDGEFDSGLLLEGEQFVHKFTKADIYEYFCMVHPWMTGKITVHEQ